MQALLIFISALLAVSTGAPSYERYADGWGGLDDLPVGLLAPAPLPTNERDSYSDHSMPSMVNLFLMTDPEMAGKTVETVLRTEEKILQERALSMETAPVAAASENIKRQAPAVDITKISLTMEGSDDGTQYHIVPDTKSDDSVVDEEAEKLKTMTPPPVETANVVLSQEGSFGGDFKGEEEAKSTENVPAAVVPSEIQITKDSIFEPKDPSFSYDNGPVHSGIDISKISLTSEAPETMNDALPSVNAPASYSTTGDNGVNSVPSAAQENFWEKYPLAGLIENYMRGA